MMKRDQHTTRRALVASGAGAAVCGVLAAACGEAGGEPLQHAQRFAVP
jgi:hypothetical protein